ncbi:MAG: hypothetical protein QUS35_08400 [bacterium]|nr:hypothetical protein [bacterium]
MKPSVPLNILSRVLFLIPIVLFGASSSGQDLIDVRVVGLSHGRTASRQNDREEAIVDAKLRAAEKAGVNVQSVTVVENFLLKKDWIESHAEAYLQPGFDVIDVGYGEDGAYKVVLVGKVSAAPSSPRLLAMRLTVECEKDSGYVHSVCGRPYSVYLDDSFIFSASGDTTCSVPDLSPGVHTLDLVTGCRDVFMFPQGPRYRHQFSNVKSREVFLEVGKPNSFLLKNNQVWVPGELKRLREILLSGPGESGPEPVMKYRDRNGADREVFSYFERSGDGIFGYRYSVFVKRDRAVLVDLEGRKESELPDPLFEDKDCRIVRRGASLFLIRKDI